jgi:hypothetical protein
MSVSPDVTLTGTLNNAVSTTAGTAEKEFGSVTIALCGYGSMTPRVQNQAVFGRVTSLTIAVDPTTAEFSVSLYSNGLIQPQGTYYTVTTRDSNGDVVQIEAYYLMPGSWDLSDLQPYDPSQPPPPFPPLIISQLEIVPYSSAPNFDGTDYTAFKITLTGDVNGATLGTFVPGNLYTFLIVQDGVGGHAFTWPSGPAPSNLYNGAPVDQDPNSTTVQTFVADDAGVLWAIGPGTWYA